MFFDSPPVPGRPLVGLSRSAGWRTAQRTTVFYWPRVTLTAGHYVGSQTPRLDRVPLHKKLVCWCCWITFFSNFSFFEHVVEHHWLITCSAFLSTFQVLSNYKLREPLQTENY